MNADKKRDKQPGESVSSSSAPNSLGSFPNFYFAFELPFAIGKEDQPYQQYQSNQPHPHGRTGLEIGHHQTQHQQLQAHFAACHKGMAFPGSDQSLVKVLMMGVIPFLAT